MDKTKRYHGILIIIVAFALSLGVAIAVLKPMHIALMDAQSTLEQKDSQYKTLQNKMNIVKKKIADMRNASISAKKKIYAPIESDLGDDTLFFNLYNDLLEMLRANSIRVKSIDYTYNPEDDNFVKHGEGKYFVFNIDMELVSNYENLGKLIENIYSYPYYIKINNVDVRPYEKDRKILNTKMSLSLYSKTSPDEDTPTEAQ